ncbi:hypothetical protein HDU77_002452 [Chytriomyces hyalinus]|nr:hypothetical protein HDU77_002452 [Chytriomyces hyalinus]
MNGTVNIAQVQAAFEHQKAAFVRLEAAFMQQQQLAAKKFQEAAERLDADMKQHEAAATQMEELLAQHRMAASKTQAQLAMMTENETEQEVAVMAEAMEGSPSPPRVQRRRRSYEIEQENYQKLLEQSKMEEEGVHEKVENQERDDGSWELAELERGEELTAEGQMRVERKEDIERVYEVLDYNIEVAARQALTENGPWFGGLLKMKVDMIVGQVHVTFDRVIQAGMMESVYVSDVKQMVTRVMDEDGVSEGAVAAVGGDVFRMMFMLGLEVGVYGWGSYVVEERVASAVAMWVEDVGVGIEGFDSMEDYVFHEIDAALSSLEEVCSFTFEKIRTKGEEWYGSLQTAWGGEIEWDLLKSESMEAVLGDGGVVGLGAGMISKVKSETFDGMLHMLWQVEMCLMHEGNREERWSILQTCSIRVKTAMRRLVQWIATVDASVGIECLAEDVPKANPYRRKHDPVHREKLWEDVEIPETLIEEESSDLCDDTGLGRWHDWEYVVYSEEDWSFDAEVEEELQRQFISCGRWR